MKPISALSFAVLTKDKTRMHSNHGNINNRTHVEQKYMCHH